MFRKLKALLRIDKTTANVEKSINSLKKAHEKTHSKIETLTEQLKATKPKSYLP
jgi:prefoldin subunit 5